MPIFGVKRWHFGACRTGRNSARRASSLARTLIVGCSTLAILLVCFSMYQYSQSELPPTTRPPRLPTTPAEPSPPVPLAGTPGLPGVPIGQGVIGPGQDITITIYPTEGTRARMELSVRDWVPKDGSDHEFLLSNPEIRMRTKDGNAVRVTALSGELEARRKSGGGLDPKRGRLTGGVRIEFDRRSDKDKALLPEAQRETPTPADLVLVETEVLDFDMQYSRVGAPGRIRVTARDVELDAEDLEVRFNESEGRVESLRIARGGFLRLSDPQRQYALSVPGVDRGGDRRTTVVDWLRATIQARLQTPGEKPGSEAPLAAAPPAPVASDVPVFRTKEERQERASQPVRYFARFDGEVDARHLVDAATQSRLQADALEILRDFSDADKERVRSAAAPKGTVAEPAAAPLEPAEQIVLEWTGRLVVDALSPGDPRLTESVRSRVTATGSPAKLMNPEGQAECTQLVYEPDESSVRLEGSVEQPVMVHSDQGTMSGPTAHVRRHGDDLEIVVSGPGRLIDSRPVSDAGAANVGKEVSAASTIEFGQELRAFGRFVTRTSIDFTGTLSTAEHRVLDRATLTGRVKIVDDASTVEADRLDIAFAERGGRNGRTLIERLHGTGNVVMIQGKDRVTCREIEVSFAPDAAGRASPTSATAIGEVVAQQGERTLTAGESLIVDFGASASGAAPDSKMAVRRLRGVGGVTVDDPVQALSVSAQELDCDVIGGREIEKAVVIGSDAQPATVKLETLTVSGARVNLNAKDQWAEVPGAGRLTFLSRKDLDGKPLNRPMPVAVTWSQSMRFRGRENRAVFDGDVHAAGESANTFDCDQLLIDFADVAGEPRDSARADVGALDHRPSDLLAPNLGILQPFVDRAMGKTAEGKLGMAGGGWNKEPVYLLADGHAVAEMAEFHEGSVAMLSRARISGPRLSVNLRSEEAKMLIEGAGNLQIEDFRPPAGSAPAGGERRGSDLFGVDKESGPSKTLIEWQERMWYDYPIAQARFEGQVQLKHFSGAALEKLFELASDAPLPPGRSTFLRSDLLTVDFTDRDAGARKSAGRRSGRLSAAHLRQFHAAGAVVLQDEVEGLSVTADSVVFERPRQLLAISGSKLRKAVIITQKKGKLPNQVATERLFYNFTTGQLELVQTTVKGQ